MYKSIHFYVLREPKHEETRAMKKKKNCCHFSGKANPVTTHLRSFVVIRESAA